MKKGTPASGGHAGVCARVLSACVRSPLRARGLSFSTYKPTGEAKCVTPELHVGLAGEHVQVGMSRSSVSAGVGLEGVRKPP